MYMHVEHTNIHVQGRSRALCITGLKLKVKELARDSTVVKMYAVHGD